MLFLDKNHSMETLSTTLSAGNDTGTTSTSSFNFSNINNDLRNQKEFKFYLLSEFGNKNFNTSRRRPSARITVINKNFNEIKPKKLNYAMETYEFNRLETIRNNSNRNAYSTSAPAAASAKSSDHIKMCMTEFNPINFFKNVEEIKHHQAIGLCKITSVKNLNQLEASKIKAPNNKIAQRKQFNKYEFIERDERNSLFKRIAPTYFVK